MPCVIDDPTWTKLTAAHPAVRIDRPSFSARAASSDVTGECLPDFFLASAAAAGDAAAIQTIEEAHFPAVRAALARSGAKSGELDDLVQAVRERLFVGDAPRIGQYSGKSPLARWLKVVTLRTATSSSRKITETPTSVGLDELPSDQHGADPELAFLRRTFAPLFEAAFRAAAAALTPEERNLLRYHYVERLSLERIGHIYGIHGVSAARRIQRVRARLLDLTKEQLRKETAVSSSELVSILGLIEDQLDLSVPSLFR